MKLRLMHKEAIWKSGQGKISLSFWRKQTTRRVIDSLRPGPMTLEPLTVRDDGLVMQGNTRLKVLLERAYTVENLPYSKHKRDPHEQ